MQPDEYATQYRQMEPFSARGLLRHSALSLLATYYQISGRMAAGLTRNRVQFLTLHYVFKDEEDCFRRLLQVLSEQHYFVSYSDAVTKITNGNIDRPYIALSFDDGLKSCLRAAQIMDEFRIKSCFFVCPSVIGETDYPRIKEFCSERLHIPPTEFMSWGDLETLLKAGHEIGAHTLTHANLARIPVPQVEAEIAGSWDILARVGGAKHFAWPFGHFMDFNPAAARIVFSTGFETCASGERGCHIAVAGGPKSVLFLRRDNLIARWPACHSLYFLAKNSLMASTQENQWPLGWLDITRDEESNNERA